MEHYIPKKKQNDKTKFKSSQKKRKALKKSDAFDIFAEIDSQRRLEARVQSWFEREAQPQSPDLFTCLAL